MDLNSEENRETLITYFPHLKDDKYYAIRSQPTPVYNCIAWAMGYDDRWVDIYYLPGHWWPDGVARDTSPQSLIDAFVAEGFERVDDRHYEVDYDKVVLFQKNGVWTHASRITSEDTEHSKFGESFDGEHSRGIFADSLYGSEYAYLRRLVTNKPTAAIARGSIIINWQNININRDR